MMRNVMWLGAMLAMAASMAGCRAESSVGATGSDSTFEPLTCDSCRIRLAETLRFSSFGGTADFGPVGMISRGPYHGFLATMLIPPHAVAVFDSTGRHLGTFGKRGQGPDEITAVLRAVGTVDDSIVVLTPGYLKIFGPSRSFARSFRTPSEGMVNEIVPVGPNRYVAVVSTPGQHPFLYLNRHFELERMVGSVNAGPTPAGYSIAPDRSGGFWALKFGNNLDLVHFDSSGSQLSVPAIRLPYFPGGPGPGQEQYDPFAHRPTDRTTGIWIDPHGMIWISLRKADENWAATMEPLGAHRESASRNPLAMVDQHSRWYDTWVAVINSQGGALVSTRILDGSYFISADGVFQQRGEYDDRIIARVLNPTLRGMN